jgi:hypothetical protein
VSRRRGALLAGVALAAVLTGALLAVGTVDGPTGPPTQLSHARLVNSHPALAVLRAPASQPGTTSRAEVITATRPGTHAFKPSAGRLPRTTSYAFRNVGAARLGPLAVPQRSMLLWTSAAHGRFRLSGSGTRSVRVSSAASSGRHLLPAGVYDRIEIRAPGAWTIQILPDA